MGCFHMDSVIKKKETVPFLFLYTKSTCASWGITITIIIIIIVVILKRDHQSHSFEKALNLKKISPGLQHLGN